MKFFRYFIVCLVVSSTLFAQQNSQKKPSKLQFEYVQIVRKLDSIQKIAKQDSELIAEGEALKRDLTKEMIKNDPSVKELIDRRSIVEAQINVAMQSEDKQHLVILQENYQQLTDKILEHQNEALKNPKFYQRANAIDAKLLKRMEAIDPNTPKLIKRLKELKEKLKSEGEQ